uniref:Activating signal cointegrator 1 complex subunit 2 n=1 Tax=Lygus hesperus TaxID=30085 RepID=A0A0A9YWP2_LYGHE
MNIASLYENAFPSAVKQVQECCDNDETMSLYFTLMFKLNNARFYFIKMFRLCIQEALKTTANQHSDLADCQAYLDVMSECLTCTVFMKDYHSKFPIDHDLDAIAQNFPDFDSIKYNFLLESLMACFDQPVKQNNGEQPRIPKPKKTTRPQPQAKEPQAAGGGEASNEEDIHLKISEVKDCLPHLGDGFIMKCLEHFAMSTSATINAILEDALPKEINELDHELPFIPPEEDHSSFGRVYGENEYVEMCKDFEKQYEVHRGKKQAREKDLKELMDDKSFRKECGNRFSQLGIIESLDNVYDDEYDDTYDDSELPVPEVEEPDRKFVVPRVLQQGRRKNQEEGDSGEEEEEEESEEQKRQRSNINFCENPEDMRARWAQKRMANMRHPPAPKKDVVGNAKGQGQDAKVLRNRQQKTVNKSANRKKAAQFKQSKGMF